MAVNEITIKQLNSYVKNLLESDPRLTYIAVKGEISNFKSHFSSGHWYFSLKDNESAVKCVMFSWSANRVKFLPQDGMSVVLKGRVSLYEKDGQFQFYAEEMTVAGEGDLAAEFLRLKEKLQKEGLFDAESKRPIVKFPKRIAVVTSGSGAASEDIKNVMARRFPLCEILMCPAPVQGVGAASQIVSVLDRVYQLENIDTVIIGRGGGSAEDLQVFNDENLVRKVYESPFPVISAVGHETDFTLCDFVADLRAPTPSAAAELAVPDAKKLYWDIKNCKNSAIIRMNLKVKVLTSVYDKLSLSLQKSGPERKIKAYEDKISLLKSLCVTRAEKNVENRFASVSKQAAKLDAMSPLKVMARGYAVAESDGKIIKSVDQISTDKNLTVILGDGKAECTVNSITKKVL